MSSSTYKQKILSKINARTEKKTLEKVFFFKTSKYHKKINFHLSMTFPQNLAQKILAIFSHACWLVTNVTFSHRTEMIYLQGNSTFNKYSKLPLSLCKEFSVLSYKSSIVRIVHSPYSKSKGFIFCKGMLY